MRNIPDIVQKTTVICVCILLGTGYIELLINYFLINCYFLVKGYS
jgi:hypothetical protein